VRCATRAELAQTGPRHPAVYRFDFPLRPRPCENGCGEVPSGVNAAVAKESGVFQPAVAGSRVRAGRTSNGSNRVSSDSLTAGATP